MSKSTWSVKFYILVLLLVLPQGTFASAQALLDVDADYMLWWTNGNRLPSLITTSPPGTPQTSAGVLPGATTLFGDATANDSVRHGGRFRLTRWLDQERVMGLDLWYAGAGQPVDGDYSISSSGSQILARPFFNTLTSAEDAQLVAFQTPAGQPIVAGSIDVSTSSEFHSAGALGRYSLSSTEQSNWHLLAGYRFLRFRDALSVEERLVSTNPVGLIPIGTTIELNDTFQCHSNFHGFDMGVAWSVTRNWLTWESTARVATGAVNKRAQINGATEVTVPGFVSIPRTGGFLALPSNIGSRDENDFAFLPDVGTKARFLLTDSIEANIGYNALCLTNVLRVDGALDRQVDPRQLTGFGGVGIPTTGSPQSPMKDATFFAQGLSFGIGVTR